MCVSRNQSHSIFRVTPYHLSTRVSISFKCLLDSLLGRENLYAKKGDLNKIVSVLLKGLIDLKLGREPLYLTQSYLLRTVKFVK